MAIKGNVFDVSSAKDFYGKGGSYEVFAGKDCTRAIALWTKNPSDVKADISDLNKDQLEQLDTIYNTLYKVKYKIVGVMDYSKGIQSEL